MGKRILTYAGIVSLLQAVAQIAFTALGIAQYLGFVDFLHEQPQLIFIKMLYFNDPDRAGNVITIGHAIDGIANQAFVLITKKPFTVNRTFIINCSMLSLGLVWAISSSILLAGGALKDFSRPIRWPWVTVTVAVCAVDLVAIVIFSNDSFHTRTLNDIMKYIGGTASGVGGVTINTTAASWIMVTLYSRFVVLFIQNVLNIVLVVLNKNKLKESSLNLVENPDLSVTVVPPAPPQLTLGQARNNVFINENFNSSALLDNIPSKSAIFNKIGAVELSNDLLDTKESLNDYSTKDFNKNSERKSYWYNIPRAHLNRKYCNFNQLKDRAIKANLETPAHKSGRGRNTVGELKGQHPWSYLPGRHYLLNGEQSSDEDRPPTPHPDYRQKFGSLYRISPGSLPKIDEIFY